MLGQANGPRWCEVAPITVRSAGQERARSGPGAGQERARSGPGAGQEGAEPDAGDQPLAPADPSCWPVIPQRVPVAGHTSHVGRFASEQDQHVIMVCSYAPRRLNRLVVPPRTEADDAARLMAEAADPTNARTASELLAAAAGSDSAAPEFSSAFLPTTFTLPRALTRPACERNSPGAGPSPGRHPRSRRTVVEGRAVAGRAVAGQQRPARSSRAVTRVTTPSRPRALRPHRPPPTGGP
ncbi:DUF5994 family protein [Kitasatospora sp. NPDC002227]|uniref:DUF5994 family protein n=1 Tax=Kitasatospora sp. NPDC002227 TaxID=3154773 RepID=UPI0033204009